MTWTTPITPVTQTTITTAWAQQTIVNNLNWLRALTGSTDPPGSGYSPESVSASAATWVQHVRRTGDTMSNDLVVTRSASGTPLAGYLILGNDSAKYIGFDGAKHVIQTPRLDVTGDAYIYRQGAQTTGYLVLGINSAHFVGFDGTNIVADGSPVWTDANSPLRVTTARIADLAVTTAKLADLAVTNAKIANTTIAGDAKLAPSSVTGNAGGSAIGVNCLHANRLAAGTLDAGEINRVIPAGQIAADRLAVGVAVPSGLIAGFRTAAAIASGWQRCDGAGGRPNLNGRLLVGATIAGTPVGGVDWPENAASGSSWTLQSVTGLPSSGPVSSGSGSTTNPGDHTHAVPWTIPMFAVVWAIKS